MENKRNTTYKEARQCDSTAKVRFFDDRHYVQLAMGGKKRYFRSTSECVNYCNENGIDAEVAL